LTRNSLLTILVIVNLFVSTGFLIVNHNNPKTRQSYGLNGNVRSVDIKYFNTSERDSSYFKNEVYKFNRNGYCTYERIYNYIWGYPNYKNEYYFDSKDRLLSKRKYNHNNEIVQIEVSLYSINSVTKQLVFNSDSSTVNKVNLYVNTKNLQIKEMFNNLDTIISTKNHPNIDSVLNLNEQVILKSYYWSLLSNQYKLQRKVIYDKEYREIESYQVGRPDTKSIWFTYIDQATGGKIDDCCDSWFLYIFNPQGKVTKEIQLDEQTQLPCIVKTYTLDKFGNPTDVIVTNILEQTSKIKFNYTYDSHGNWTTREEVRNEKIFEMVTREILYE